MIPLKGFSDYFLENVSVAHNKNQIQISSVCNGKCFFCSNEQNPFQIHRTDFRPVSEIEKLLFSFSIEPGVEIRLGDSLPGRISEGEALLHPQLFEILALIRNRCNNPIAITTNGSLLTKDTIEQLAKYNPIRITLSISSLKERYWVETFSLEKEYYEIVKQAIPLMLQNRIKVIPSLIPMPSWVGYEDIEETISILATHGIKEALVYAPGYTKYTDKEAIKRLHFDMDKLSLFLSQMSSKYKIAFDWFLDPNRALMLDEQKIKWFLNDLFKNNVFESHWFTSVAAYERFKAKLEGLKSNIPINTYVHAVENKTYGGNIQCVGLLTIRDIESAIEQFQLEGKVIFVPGGFLDSYGFDLEGNNMIDFVKHCKNKIIII